MPKIRLTLIVIASSAAWFGLAILGAGGFAPFFSHTSLTALAIVTVALTALSLFSPGNLSAGVREDRGNRWVLIAFALLGFLSAWLPALTDRIGLWTIGGNAIRWPGVFLFSAGSALRIWPVFVLGRRFSGLVAIQPGHTLVTTGIYRVIRNPSYLGALVMMIGWSLAFRSGIGLVLTALMVPPLVARMHAEERLLRSQFGAEYEAYCARTSRLIPGLY